MLLGANAINKFYKIENIFYNIYFIQIIIHSMLHEQFEYKGENYIIIIGKNKSENFIIIDESFATDIWFHIEHEPSCHVILKNTLKIRDIPKVVIKRCAYLCKINSKAKTQKKTDVIYTQISNVAKTNIVGQVSVDNCKRISV